MMVSMKSKGRPLLDDNVDDGDDYAFDACDDYDAFDDENAGLVRWVF